MLGRTIYFARALITLRQWLRCSCSYTLGRPVSTERPRYQAWYSKPRDEAIQPRWPEVAFEKWQYAGLRTSPLVQCVYTGKSCGSPSRTRKASSTSLCTAVLTCRLAMSQVWRLLVVSWMGCERHGPSWGSLWQSLWALPSMITREASNQGPYWLQGFRQPTWYDPRFSSEARLTIFRAIARWRSAHRAQRESHTGRCSSLKAMTPFRERY